MTDPSNPTAFEEWLSAELHRAAALADDPRSAAVVAQGAMRMARPVAQARRLRRWGPLLGLAAALLLPAAGVFLVASRNETAPPTVTGWDAILVADPGGSAYRYGAGGSALEVIRVTADGTEHTVRQIDGQDGISTSDPVAYYYTRAHVASTDGWLAVRGHVWYGFGQDDGGIADAWQLVDLTDPSRSARTVWADPTEEGLTNGDAVDPVETVAWGPHGRFASRCGATSCSGPRPPPWDDTRPPSGTVQVLDVATATSVMVDGLAMDDLPVTMTADGAGLVRASGTGPADGLTVVPIAGGATPRVVPAIAWRPGPRWAVGDGTWIDSDTAVVHSPTGAQTDWSQARADGTEPGTLGPGPGASLAADGRSVWLMLDGRAAVLLRATTPESAIKVASIGGRTAIAFGGIAPDDSMLALRFQGWTAGAGSESPSNRAWRGSTAGDFTVLVRTSDGRVTSHSAWFAGFAPSGLLP